MATVRESLKDKFIFFGPGLLLAITAAGEFGIIEATEAGAHYGLNLIWVVLVTLMFKYVFTTGIARYTLATGKTIFDGLKELPGPARWGQILIVAAFLVDLLALGSMVVFAATYLDYILPGTYAITALSFLIMMLVTLIVRMRKSHYFEILVAALIIAMSVSMTIVMIDFPIDIANYIDGLRFEIPEHSESTILSIIGVCGNGLNIMLYSHWLDKKIKASGVDVTKKKSFFGRYIKSVRWDLGLGFLAVLLITIGFMEVGYIGSTTSLLPHGAEMTLDALITQVMYLFKPVPLGLYVFPLILMLIFVGAVSIGMEARISVIGRIIRDYRKDQGLSTPMNRVYFLLYWVFFAGIMAVVFVGQPMVTIRLCSSVCALLFGVFGFIAMYLDSTLPDYAKGSRLWRLLLGLGSVLSMYIALLIESSFLQYGLPLLQSMIFGMVLVFALTKMAMFKDTLSGKADPITRLWVMGVLGVVSVFGTFGGVAIIQDTYSLAINFRDLGAMMAGVVGGPWMGLGAALIGGVYRLSLGGVTAVPCFLATLVAGVGSGLLMRHWKGKFTFKRAAKTGMLFELLHIVVIFPVYELITGLMDPTSLGMTVLMLLLPMTIVNTLGMCAFWYIVKDDDLTVSSSHRLGLVEMGRSIKKVLAGREYKDDE